MHVKGLHELQTSDLRVKLPIVTLKTSWSNVRKKAGVSGRWHDNRHTLVTDLAEGGAGDETIRDIAGHVSKQMLKHYSHIRMEAKRKALEAMVQPLAHSKAGNTESASVVQAFGAPAPTIGPIVNRTSQSRGPLLASKPKIRNNVTKVIDASSK